MRRLADQDEPGWRRRDSSRAGNHQQRMQPRYGGAPAGRRCRVPQRGRASRRSRIIDADRGPSMLDDESGRPISDMASLPSRRGRRRDVADVTDSGTQRFEEVRSEDHGFRAEQSSLNAEQTRPHRQNRRSSAWRGMADRRTVALGCDSSTCPAVSAEPRLSPSARAGGRRDDPWLV
jgi:hypothetical protein